MSGSDTYQTLLQLHSNTQLPPDYQEYVLDLLQAHPALRKPTQSLTPDTLADAYAWAAKGPFGTAFGDVHPFVACPRTRAELVTFLVLVAWRRSNYRRATGLVSAYVHAWKRYPVLNPFAPAMRALLTGQRDVPVGTTIQALVIGETP